MFRNVSRVHLVGGWCVLMFAIAAALVFAGAAISVANGGLLFAACVAPPVVMLLIWGGGAPPATVAELLHTVNRPSKDV